LKNQLHVTGITDLNMVKNQWNGRPIMSMDDNNVVEVHMTTLSYQCVMIEQLAHMVVAASQNNCQYQNIC
jgi:metal-sulfur cluster biosynthetic enzyme